MDNSINQTIVNKVAIKSVAIKATLATLPPPTFKDLWAEKNSIEHQKNYENKSVSEINDTMKSTKTNSIPNDWKDITDPKLRKKMCKKAWYEANKDKIKLKKKAYREANKDKIKIQQQKKYQNNKAKYKHKLKERIQNNPELFKKRWKQYRSVNKDQRYKNQLDWKRRNKNNVQYKLSCRLRDRLCHAIKNNYKSGSAVGDLGCSIDQFKQYMESKFQPGMTWDNWGKYGWHIDHIKPLASFDLSDRNQLLEACHYTNLQPLWASDNLSKGDKLP